MTLLPDRLLEGANSPMRFGAGLTEADVARLQLILREQCGREVTMPEAWSRAIEILSLVEVLVESQTTAAQHSSSTGFALPRS